MIVKSYVSWFCNDYLLMEVYILNTEEIKINIRLYGIMLAVNLLTLLFINVSYNKIWIMSLML